MRVPNFALSIPADAELPLVFALTSSATDLEARARIASSVGGELGRRSAAEYRLDVSHLLGLLRQLGFSPSWPDPEGEALTWLDRPYVICDGVPVCLVPARRPALCAAPLSLPHHSRG